MSGLPGFGGIFSRTRNPPKRKPLLGICVHEMDERSMQALAEIRIQHVRTTLYMGGNREWYGTPLPIGYDYLVVLRGHFTPDDVKRAVRAHPHVQAWQIGNEVDVEEAQSDNIARYGQFLGECYGAVKYANPEALVVASGLAGDGSFARNFHPGSFDAVALHAYGPPSELVARRKIAEVRKWVHYAPIWVTEFGFEPKQKLEVEPWWYQRKDWGLMMTADLDAERIYGYVLHGDAHAIYAEDWTPRPTVEMLKNR